MKKSYLLLSGLIMTSAFLSAQQELSGVLINSKNQEQNLYSGGETQKYKQTNTKAYRDTLYYEDFANQIPSGWISEDRNNANLVWIWDDGAPGGQFSTNARALASTSGSNGYLSLPSDRYNTPLPDPVLTMDAMITSPAIPIQPTHSVILTFQHSQRYCCSGANELVVEVSTDSVVWETFDATGGRGANTGTPNGEILEINVSDVLANEDTAYIRFRSTGNSHYYWMIDDLALIEGPLNAIELEDIFIINNQEFRIAPIYTRIPITQIDSAFYQGFIRNFGSNDQTNTTFDVTVTHDSLADGSNGVGLKYSESASFISPLPAFNSPLSNRDTTIIANPGFMAENKGFHTITFTVNSDSVNELVPSRYTKSAVLAITDTVFALDNGSFQDVTGPSDYVSAGLDNDLALMLFIVKERISVSSITAFIGNRNHSGTQQSRVIDAQISPRVFSFDEDLVDFNNASTLDLALDINNPVASSPFSYTITNNDTNSWVTVPFLERVNLEPGAYYVGFEQTGGGVSEKAMVFGRDRVAEETAPPMSVLYFTNSATGGWSSVGSSRMPAIRMNIDVPVSIREFDVDNKNFNVSPNPNNGVFKVEFSETNSTNNSYVLNVRNMLGQTIHTESVTTAGGRLNKYLDLSAYEKGVYFISLENDESKLLRKVIVK